MTAHEIYTAAHAKYLRIVAGDINETQIMAWASVARSCQHAKDAFRRENADYAYYGRWQLSFLDNVERIHWIARANVESLAKH
jgi:hypothetical protein